jgi:hypothetical protein
MHHTNNRHLRRAGPHFLLIDPHGNGQSTLNPKHVREVLAYDRLLREFKHTTGKRPGNYDNIADVFNADLLCHEKLARSTTTIARNTAVVITGPSPDIDASDAPPRSPTFGHSIHRGDDRELIEAARKILGASEKSLRRKGSRSNRDNRRHSLHHASGLDTYSAPGPSSSQRRVSRLNAPIDRVPGHTFESEDAVMHSEIETGELQAEDETFDPNTSAPVDDAAIEEPAEYE